MPVQGIFSLGGREEHHLCVTSSGSIQTVIKCQGDNNVETRHDMTIHTGSQIQFYMGSDAEHVWQPSTSWRCRRGAVALPRNSRRKDGYQVCGHHYSRCYACMHTSVFCASFIQRTWPRNHFVLSIPDKEVMDPGHLGSRCQHCPQSHCYKGMVCWLS